MTTPTFSASDTLRGRGMGVSVDCPTRCKMCEAHEVREEYDRQKIQRIGALSGELAFRAYEDRKHAKSMQHQRNMALVALGMGVLMAIASAVWK